MRDRDPAEVRDGLAEDELAVDVEVPLDDVAVELLFDAPGARLVVLQVVGSPPLALVALRVELAAGVVEAVRHLVADDRADPAVVDGVVRLGIEKWRLKD